MHNLTNKLLNEMTNEWISEWIDKWMHKQMNRWVIVLKKHMVKSTHAVNMIMFVYFTLTFILK